MAFIKTSKGNLTYKQSLLSKFKTIDSEKMLDNIRILQVYLDKIGITWGPAFGTLIGIVRNDDFLPWANAADFFVLKEDEERFKDVIWLLKEVGFSLIRYERRGLYCLLRDGQVMSFYLLRKISPDIRHSGGSHFLFDSYLQDMVKWDFKGVKLNVPAKLDEYLTFQYGDWIHPHDTHATLGFFSIIKLWVKDRLPNKVYFHLILKHHIKDFEAFKKICKNNGVAISDDIELSYSKPRKGKKVLTVGVYDLLHKGHVELFRRARGLGDHLIVAVQDGDLILKYKPTAKVLNSTDDRMYMVKSIRYVDEVIVYEGVDEIVKNVDFDIFVSGPDQIHQGFQNAIKWCEENGKEHIVLARTDGVSSSELKAKIAEKIKKGGAKC